MDYSLWLEEANKRIEEDVCIGQCFVVRDLFESVDWEKLDKGDRIAFGKFFSNAVKTGIVPHVQRIEKKANNHAQYIKIDVQRGDSK